MQNQPCSARRVRRSLSLPRAVGWQRVFFPRIGTASLAVKFYSSVLFALLILYYQILILGLTQLVNAYLWLISHSSHRDLPDTLDRARFWSWCSSRYALFANYGGVSPAWSRDDLMTSMMTTHALLSVREVDAPQLFQLINDIGGPSEGTISRRSENLSACRMLRRGVTAVTH